MCGPQVRFRERGPRETGGPYSTDTPEHDGTMANPSRRPTVTAVVPARGRAGGFGTPVESWVTRSVGATGRHEGAARRDSGRALSRRCGCLLAPPSLVTAR